MRFSTAGILHCFILLYNLACLCHYLSGCHVNTTSGFIHFLDLSSLLYYCFNFSFLFFTCHFPSLCCMQIYPYPGSLPKLPTMMSRSGFSIRKFVRQTPRNSLDSDGPGYVDIERTRPSSKDEQSEKSKGRTWRRTKRPPPPILVIRRSENIHLISSPLPPLPDTPHSTSSSLDSCDYRSCPRTPAGKESPTLCSIVPNGSSSLSPQISNGGGGRQQYVSVTKDDTSKFYFSPPPHIVTMPDSIEQLIKVTNRAFEDVGTALDEARIAVQSPVPQSLHLDSPAQSLPGLSPSRSSPRTPKYSSPLNTPTRKASVTKSSRKPAKNGRQKLVQPRQKQQRQQQSQAKANQTAKATKAPARWTLGENVSELLNGRLFNRIVADEMVTSEQVEQWRQKNPRVEEEEEQLLDDAISVDSLRIFDLDYCETPVEPFHMDDLPSRIGAAGLRTSMPSSLDAFDSSAIGLGLEVIHEDFSLPPRPQTQPPRPKPLPSPFATEEDMKFQHVSFPAPPLKSPIRLNSPHRQLPPLPTIMEAAAGSPVATHVVKPFKQTRKKSVRKGPEMRQAKVTDESIYFASTPFSITMPTYRHGPVRLSRADVRTRSPVQPFIDETLDWTAFQMAILGASTDYQVESGDTDDEQQASDLLDWFAEFDLGYEGKMLTSAEEEVEYMATAEIKPVEKVEKQRNIPTAILQIPQIITPQPVDIALTIPLPPSPTTTEAFSPISTLGSPRENSQPEMIQIRRIPTPLFIERPSGGSWNARFDFSLGRWVLDSPNKGQCGDEQRLGSATSSLDSMPQSPMLDLVVSRGVMGEDYVVPMGFNMGHDLGDFLQWEAQNVALAGFYGC